MWLGLPPTLQKTKKKNKKTIPFRGAHGGVPVLHGLGPPPHELPLVGAALRRALGGHVQGLVEVDHRDLRDHP